MDYQAAHDAWVAWLDQVPEDKREKLAEILSQSDLTSYVGVAEMQHQLQTALVRGLLSPPMIHSFRLLTKDAMTALYLADDRYRQPEVASVTFRQMNIDLVKKLEPLQPVYRRSIGDQLALDAAVPDVIDGDEEEEED